MSDLSPAEVLAEQRALEEAALREAFYQNRPHDSFNNKELNFFEEGPPEIPEELENGPIGHSMPDPDLFNDTGQKDIGWKKALQSSHFAPKAKAALASEKESLIDVHKILVLLTPAHPEYNDAVKQAIKCRALLDIKRDGRVKVRIVKLGFYESTEGEGFISAQVVSRESVNTLLACHNPNHQTLATMDVSTAFLQAEKFDKTVIKYCYLDDPVTKE